MPLARAPVEPGALTLCVLSDTHGHERALGALPPADVLVHCGDFGGLGPLDRFLAAQPHAGAKLVLRGNHDKVLSGATVARLPRSGALYASRAPALFAVAGLTLLLVPYARGPPRGAPRGPARGQVRAWR